MKPDPDFDLATASACGVAHDLIFYKDALPAEAIRRAMAEHPTADRAKVTASARSDRRRLLRGAQSNRRRFRPVDALMDDMRVETRRALDARGQLSLGRVRFLLARARRLADEFDATHVPKDRKPKA